MEEQEKFHNLLREQMHKISQRKVYMTACSHILLSLVTAPLFTVSTSLQISNPNNVVTIS